MKVSERFAKNNLKMLLLAMGLLVGLLVVLLLAVVRVQNLRPTLERPKAAGGISNSKLSVFVFNSYGDADLKKIADACPKVIKVLDPQGNAAAIQLVKDYKAKCSGGKVLMRVVTRGREYLTTEDPRASARDYFNSRLAGALNSLGGDLALFDYIEDPNEAEEVTDWSGGPEATWLGGFYDELAGLVESRASNLGICPSVSVGDWGTGGESAPGRMENAIMFKMQVSEGAWTRIKQTGGALCYHGYSYNLSKDAEAEKWLTFRYRIAYRYFENYRQDLVGLPVILSEAGAETYGGNNGGWASKVSASQYQDWLSWFDSEIKKDAYVLGATLYSYGSGSRGSSYDVKPIAAWLAQHIISGGPTPPPPPPNPPPPNPPPPNPPPPGGTQTCVNTCVNSTKYKGNYSFCNYCCGNRTCKEFEGPTTPPPGATACYSDCFSKTGNGSGCRYVCDNSPSCFTGCVAGGKEAKVCLGECLNPATQTHLGCVTGEVSTTSGPVCTKVPGPGKDECSVVGEKCTINQPSNKLILIDDTDSRILYEKIWNKARTQTNYPNPRGGSFTGCNKAKNADCKASIAKDETLAFDSVTIGFPTRPNGSSAMVLIDGQSVGQLDQSGPLVGDYLKYTPWKKSVPCGSHKVEIVPDWKTGTGNQSVAIDYIELRRCSLPPAACTNDSECRPSGKICRAGLCATPGEVDKCWGEAGGKGGRCYDCNGDGTVNILDFSCFSIHWLENLGKI